MFNQDLRRYAPYALYLSGLALVAAAVLYIIEQSFALPVQISLGIVVLGLAGFVLLDPQRAKEALTGRQARYGSNSLVLAIALIGILVVINYLVNNHNKQWDLTEDKTNTLAPESIQTLNSLASPVLAEAYYSSSYPIGNTKDLLENYKRNSDGKFDYEVIDPVQSPVRANEAKVTRDGTIVLKADGRQEQVSYASEQEITAAMIRLVNPGQRAVYFLTGHGEYNIEGTEQQSYSSVKTSLSAKNYTVNTLDLLSNPQVPQDALAVIIPGPKKPLSEQEVQALATYLSSGGSVVYLSEPRPATSFGDAADPMANYLEQSWGIRLDEDMVIDLNNSQQPLVAVGTQFGKHTITDKLATSAVLFPVSRSLQVLTAPQGITLTALVSTTQNSWGETDYASLNSSQVTPDQNKDVMGPLTLAIAGIDSATKGRVVVIGDSDFASTQNFTAYGNGDFLLNSIDWAAEQENLINLSAKESTTRTLVVPERLTMGLILFGAIFLLPGLILVTGITVWIQRRRRG